MASTLFEISQYDLYGDALATERGDRNTSAVADAIRRSFPLLAYRDNPSIAQSIVLILHAPVDTGMDGLEQHAYISDYFLNSPLTPYLDRIEEVEAIVLAQSPSPLLQDDVRGAIRQAAKTLNMEFVYPAPIFFDPFLTPGIPEELGLVMQAIDEKTPDFEIFEVPLFSVPAGGIDHALRLAQVGVVRRGTGDYEEFAAEAKSLLRQVLGVWSLDSAMSWMRSSNPHLGGARPIEILALYGAHSVEGALEASEWGIFA